MVKAHTSMPGAAVSSVPYVCLCPKCNALAREESRKSSLRREEVAIRFVCPSCGWAKVRWCVLKTLDGSA